MIGRILRSVVLTLVLLTLVGGVLLALDVYRFLQQPLVVQEPRLFEVEQGMSLWAVSRKLGQEGALRSPQDVVYFAWYGRLRGDAGKIKAGEYELLPEMLAASLLGKLASGKSYQHAIRFIEGWTFSQMMKTLAADATIQHTLPDLSADAVMRAIGRAGEHPEGRFFPDTYLFPSRTSDVQVLRRAYDTMSHVLDEEWAARRQDLPLKTAYESLILASIVQKETGILQERFEIAGVFMRRLQIGMRLQTDPTIIYGLGESFDGDIRFADLRTDTPYNTYTRDGLPPTPICMPGREAINAVMHPAEGKALYFVSKGDGSHYFSETIQEHDAAVKTYQLKRPPS